MAKRNAFYAQSGGVTAVINASACGVIETARRHRDRIGKLYAGRNGIIGALDEDLIDTSKESARAIAGLRHTPGGAFGSARYKLKGLEENRAEYERLIEVFRAHDIGYFFYNGGGDSADTCLKVSQLGELWAIRSWPSTYRRPSTTTCPSPTPALASARSPSTWPSPRAKRPSMCASMSRTSTKVFILEVMGRHAGWIAAAAGLAGEKAGDPPHIILFPEVPFEQDAFLKRVSECVRKYDYCVIVVSEGARYADGRFLADAGTSDAFGHKQLGGVAPVIATMVRDELEAQVPLRHRRLPAALGPAHRLAGGRGTGLCRGQGGRGTGPGRRELGDADHRPPLRSALSLEHRQGPARPGGQSGKNDAPRAT